MNEINKLLKELKEYIESQKLCVIELEITIDWQKNCSLFLEIGYLDNQITELSQAATLAHELKYITQLNGLKFILVSIFNCIDHSSLQISGKVEKM